MSGKAQMKVEIPLEQAVQIIEEADAVIAELGGTCVLYPGVEDLTGEDSNEFMHLRCESEGDDYSADFEEKANRSVEVVGKTLIFTDTKGNKVEVTPLFSRSLLK